jgi:hypothetical protein
LLRLDYCTFSGSFFTIKIFSFFFCDQVGDLTYSSLEQR